MSEWAEPCMHVPGRAPVIPEAERLAPGTKIRGRVICHHTFGLGLAIVGRNECGHVDIVFIAPGRLRGRQDFPPVGSEVSATVAGYSGNQLRLKIFDPYS